MMKAVIFKGPYEVAVEERPIPRIQDPSDIIVKVTYTAMYRRSVLYPPPTITLRAWWLDFSDQCFHGLLQWASSISGKSKSSQTQNASYEQIFWNCARQGHQASSTGFIMVCNVADSPAETEIMLKMSNESTGTWVHRDCCGERSSC